MTQRTQANCLRDQQISCHDFCEISTDSDTFGSASPSSGRVSEVDMDSEELRSKLRRCRDPPKVQSPESRITKRCTRTPSRRHSSINASSRSPSPQKQSAISGGRYSIRSSGSLSSSLLHFILERCVDCSGPELACYFMCAPETPPITAESLSELNIDRIVTNAQLRHDINFDREIHFRPNVDCSKGRQKINAAEQYWKALVAELELYALLDSKSSLSQASQRRIPLILDTIKEILQSLLPEIDRAQVVDVLDVPVLMQQMQRGTCDLIGLAEWLAKLLKVHCAPMRDGWVDQMVEHIEDGVRNARAQSIVDGLRELLGILEAMKLDVANHQIRHLRLFLVEDTIHFEQQHHQSRIERDRILVNFAKDWLSRHSHALRQDSLRSICEDKLPNDLGAFVYALLQSLLASTTLTDSFPKTFNLDLDRLASLRTDLIDQIHLNICLDLHTDLLRRRSHHQPFSTPPITTTATTSLPKALLTIIGPPPHPHSSTPPSTRWVASLPNLTTHILHSALPSLPPTSPLAHTLHATLQHRLAHALNPKSKSFTAQTRTLLSRLLADVAAHVNDSPVALANAFVGPAHAAAAVNTRGVARVVPAILAGLDGKGLVAGATGVEGCAGVMAGVKGEMDMRMSGLRARMAHLAVLHWRVWARMVYLVGAEAGGGQKEEGLEGVLMC